MIKWSHSTGAVVAFWRMLGATATWWLLVGALHVFKGRPLPSRQAWRYAIVPGLCFGANLALFFTAVTRTSIAHAEFIAAMSPLILIPTGALLFGEHPNWRALRWGLVSIVGVALVLFCGPARGEARLAGDLLMIVVLSAWTGYMLSSKVARGTAGINTVDFMACTLPIGLITAGPIAVAVAGSDIVGLSARGWVVVGVLVVLTGMLAHACIVFAQRLIPVATISIMQTAQPALAVFFAFVLLDEQVRPLQALGMVLVITGLALFVWTSQRRAALPPRLDTDASS